MHIHEEEFVIQDQAKDDDGAKDDDSMICRQIRQLKGSTNLLPINLTSI
jgi:hypothetical protein